MSTKVSNKDLIMEATLLFLSFNTKIKGKLEEETQPRNGAPLPLLCQSPWSFLSSQMDKGLIMFTSVLILISPFNHLQ